MSGGSEQRSSGATDGDTPAPSGGDKRLERHVLVIGEGDLTEETVRALEAEGARVSRLGQPEESDVREALKGGDVDSVAVVAGEDPLVLRMALMVRAVSDEVPLLLTIFDPTMAAEMADQLPNTHVTSMADIVAPSLAGPCIEERFTAVSFDGDHPVGLVEDGDGVREEPIQKRRPRQAEALLRALFTPYDKSAGLLLFGAIGLVAVFLVEAVTAVFVLDQDLISAIYGSAKTLVTVDPNPDVAKGPGWYKLFTSATMIVALVFAAGFTAGLVNRVIDRRLTGLVGRRAGPRRDHVVVVGLGQVGLRLCLVLRACRVPVLAVERDEDGELLGLAKTLGLPVLVGRGSDPELMARVSLPKARAVAAVTADDLENIAVAMAARSAHREVRVVLRVGDGEVANETRSLLPLGLVRDVHRIAGALLAAMAVGEDAERVVCIGDETHLRFPDGRLERTQLGTLAGSGE
ncbi:MAG TPA: NAD-binding protein [Thermoleophilaceae bacterium]|nr:NAD-binding protein [Thermoleophilaceae bacterium]